MPEESRRPEGPTQWVDALLAGDLAPARSTTPGGSVVEQVGVDVAAAVAAAGAEGQTLSEEDRAAIAAVVSGSAELDTVTKELMVAAIHEYNAQDGLDPEAHIAVTGNKEELLERMRAADAS